MSAAASAVAPSKCVCWAEAPWLCQVVSFYAIQETPACCVSVSVAVVGALEPAGKQTAWQIRLGGTRWQPAAKPVWSCWLML